MVAADSELTPSAWSASLREGNACVTSKGHIGTCTTYRNCYPYFKIPDLTIWESWILGNYDTCSFYNEDGRQAFGVCCSNPITTPSVSDNSNNVDGSDSNTIIDSSNKDNNYPNWPPPIPTHPPNHTAATHPSSYPIGGTPPTISAPTTTTTKRPSTTWPTRPTTVSYPNWPPTAPTHKPIYVSSTESPNNGEDRSGCGVKNGFPVSTCTKKIK